MRICYLLSQVTEVCGRMSGPLPLDATMKMLSFLVVMILLQTTGCAAYLRDRAKDASEIIELGIGLSVGVDLSGRATKVVQAGFGSYTGDWVGLKEGRFAVWHESRIEMGVSPFFFQELYRLSDTLLEIQHPILGDPGYEEFLNDYWLITDRGFFQVGATVNLIVVGVDVGFEMGEFADFVTGWFGMDLLSDDAYARTDDELLVQMQSLDPYLRAGAVRALRRRTGQNFGYILMTPVDEYTEDQVDAWRRWKAYLESNKETEAAPR